MIVKLILVRERGNVGIVVGGKVGVVVDSDCRIGVTRFRNGGVDWRYDGRR